MEDDPQTFIWALNMLSVEESAAFVQRGGKVTIVHVQSWVQRSASGLGFRATQQKIGVGGFYFHIGRSGWSDDQMKLARQRKAAFPWQWAGMVTIPSRAGRNTTAKISPTHTSRWRCIGRSSRCCSWTAAKNLKTCHCTLCACS